MKIHFIGIGGIGVSALARYYLEKGHEISGSDLVSSEITDALKKRGAKIFIGPHIPRSVLGNIDLVVYSPAVRPDNPELKKAKKLGIKCQSYPQDLGELTKKHFTIAVCGSHGKSTVTAMIGILLTRAGVDPTVIVGTKVKEFGDSNCRVAAQRASLSPSGRGKSQYLVIEADEHFASFLNYWPKIIVLTNLEPDHLDYYKNFKNYLNSFKKFISHLPKDGILVANKDDKNIRHITRNMKHVTFYSLKQDESKKLKKILKIPGEHNMANALAALSVARALKVPDKVSFQALSEYRGSWRRFEIKKVKYAEKCSRHITLISDYAHHPTQIKATLQTARERYPDKKIWVVFQPHQYQRTFYLFDDFVKVLRNAPVDKLIITDIFDVVGREDEKIKKKISSEKLVKAINRKETIYISSIEKAANYLKKNLQGKKVVIVMGAGDIYKLCEQF